MHIYVHELFKVIQLHEKKSWCKYFPNSFELVWFYLFQRTEDEKFNFELKYTQLHSNNFNIGFKLFKISCKIFLNS